jgi:hypothetical protein
MYLAGYNEAMEIEIELYETASGNCPFDDWFESLREQHTRAKILTRLDRLKVGTLAIVKPLARALQSSGFTTDQELESITRK